MVKSISFDNFSEEIADGKVVIDFYAPWCAPCAMMSPVIEEISSVYGDVKFLKANVDEEGVLAGAFKVSSIPYFVYFINGRIVSHASGCLSGEELIKKLGLQQ